MRCEPKNIQLRKEIILIDVQLRVGGKTFHAHRNILALNSPFFRTMFTSDFVERNQSVVEIQNPDEDSFDSVLNYVYNEQISITAQNVEGLLTSASFFQLEMLKEDCLAFLKPHLSIENVIGIQHLGYLHDCDELVTSSINYIAQHFEEFKNSKQYLELTISDFEKLCACLMATAVDVEKVCEALVLWLDVTTERDKYTFQLLKVIDLKKVDPSYIKHKLYMDSRFKNCL